MLGASFDPATLTLPRRRSAPRPPVSWKVTNTFGAVDGEPGGPLGLGQVGPPDHRRPGAARQHRRGARGRARLDVAIGNVSDAAADLDLAVYRDRRAVGSPPTVTPRRRLLANPAAGHVHRRRSTATRSRPGTTAYDYLDVFYAPSLGAIKVDESAPFDLASGASRTVTGKVKAYWPLPPPVARSSAR